MKHILFILAASLMMVSCSTESKPKLENGFDNIKEITYKGHEYIIFEESYPAYGFTGHTIAVVHNPDCHCMK